MTEPTISTGRDVSLGQLLADIASTIDETTDTTVKLRRPQNEYSTGELLDLCARAVRRARRAPATDRQARDGQQAVTTPSSAKVEVVGDGDKGKVKAEKPKPTTIDDLADDCLGLIFLHLEAPRELLPMTKVCKRWRDVVESNTFIWRVWNLKQVPLVVFQRIASKYMFPDVRVLKVVMCPISAADIQKVLQAKECAQLEELVLRGPGTIADSAVEGISQVSSHLKSVSLVCTCSHAMNAHSLSDRGIRKLVSRCPNLSELSIGPCRASTLSVCLIAEACVEMESFHWLSPLLDASTPASMTMMNNSLKVLAARGKLKQFRVHLRLEDATVKAIAAANPELEIFAVEMEDGLTAADVARACPRLKYLHTGRIPPRAAGVIGEECQNLESVREIQLGRLYNPFTDGRFASLKSIALRIQGNQAPPCDTLPTLVQALPSLTDLTVIAPDPSHIHPPALHDLLHALPESVTRLNLHVTITAHPEQPHPHQHQHHGPSNIFHPLESLPNLTQACFKVDQDSFLVDLADHAPHIETLLLQGLSRVSDLAMYYASARPKSLKTLEYSTPPKGGHLAMQMMSKLNPEVKLKISPSRRR